MFDEKYWQDKLYHYFIRARSCFGVHTLDMKRTEMMCGELACDLIFDMKEVFDKPRYQPQVFIEPYPDNPPLESYTPEEKKLYEGERFGPMFTIDDLLQEIIRRQESEGAKQ